MSLPFSLPFQMASTANTEMILVADVDMDLLWKLHNQGAVRNLKDRRTDIYDIVYKGK